jgi:8-oxo-dGTP pyrophosphatase MutT (NUDIX family)
MSDHMRAIRGRIGTMVLGIPTVSILVRNAEDRVLLVRHSEGGEWSTPGGMIEPYETPADAAVREMWEETGLFVGLKRVVGVFGGQPCSSIYLNGDRSAWVSTTFEAVPISGGLKADGDEILEVRWVRPDEVGQLRCKAHVGMMIEALYSDVAEAAFQGATWRPADES